MTVARSGADVLEEHLVFEAERIDRMSCNAYVPQSQYATGLVGHVRRQLGLPIASTAPLAAITGQFVTEITRFAATHGVPWSSSPTAAQARRDARAPSPEISV